jgi:excisionase family DNA binding protein
MDDRLLTTKEAARFLGVSAAFLERDRWADANIPYVRIGSRAVRYQLSELEAYLNSNRRRTARHPG